MRNLNQEYYIIRSSSSSLSIPPSSFPHSSSSNLYVKITTLASLYHLPHRVKLIRMRNEYWMRER